MINKKLKILSLFAGAGGMDLGFKNAGFDGFTLIQAKDVFEDYRITGGFKGPVQIYGEALGGFRNLYTETKLYYLEICMYLSQICISFSPHYNYHHFNLNKNK